MVRGHVEAGHLKRNTTSCLSLSANVWLMTEYGYHRRHFTGFIGFLISAYGYSRSICGYRRFLTVLGAYSYSL